MKQKILKTLLFTSTILIASCASTTYFTIDVMQPAKTKFAENIVNVAVVDNAGAKLEGNMSTDSRISQADALASMSKDIFMTSLIQFMNEENYFHEVKQYPTTIRSDRDYGADIPISELRVQTIAKEMDADALISIDVFEVEAKEALANYSGFYYTAAQVNMKMLFRIHDAKGNIFLPIMLAEDSITWVGDKGAQYYDKDYYHQLALEMSEGMVKQLLPHWEQQQRWFYADGTKPMKEAKKYATEGNWTEAAKTWGGAFEVENKNKQKARIALNIALANENLDDIENAVTWIRIASNLIAENPNSEEHRNINWYKIKLLEREKNTPLVLEQLGVAEDTE